MDNFKDYNRRIATMNIVKTYNCRLCKTAMLQHMIVSMNNEICKKCYYEEEQKKKRTKYNRKQFAF